MSKARPVLGVTLLVLFVVLLGSFTYVEMFNSNDTEQTITWTINELDETPDGVYTYGAGTSAYDEVWIEVKNPRSDINSTPSEGLALDTPYVSCDACGLSVKHVENERLSYNRSTVDVYGGQTIVILGAYNGDVHTIDKRDPDSTFFDWF